MTNPAMATAVPVNALSSEMTTGMSAPPIGSTMVTPNARAATAMIASTGPLAAAGGQVAAPDDQDSRRDRCWRLARRGTRAAGRSRCPAACPTAISEPENVTAPMATSSAAGSATLTGIAPSGTNRSTSCTAISAAAPPPAALNRLTSCGIAVIDTRRAP